MRKVKNERKLIVLLLVILLSMLAVRFFETEKRFSRRESIFEKIEEQLVWTAADIISKESSGVEYTGANGRNPFGISPEVLAELSQLSVPLKVEEMPSEKSEPDSEITVLPELSLQGISSYHWIREYLPMKRWKP